MAQSTQTPVVSTKLELVSGPGSTTSRATDLDIIAVHGLGAHHNRSWISTEAGGRRKCMWLRDVLPDLIPGGRIYTFSYALRASDPSDILHAKSLAGIAQALVEDISSLRKKKPDTPLAFIAHDIGGVIVKKALLFADTNEEYFASISKQCKRLVFFGTPQRVSEISDSWEDLVLKLLVASPRSAMFSPSSITTKFRSLAAFIEDVATQFASCPPRHLVNVYQRLEDEAVSQPVINEYSATTGLVHEINIPRVSKHTELCIFSDSDPIISEIATFLETEIKLPYRRCLSDLSNVSPPFVIPDATPDFHLRAIDINAYTEFGSWISGPSSRIITTSGESSGGEGLLACGLLRELRRRSLFAAYFSFSRGYNASRTSTADLLASVAFQMLVTNPTRYSRIAGFHNATTLASSALTQAALLVMFQSLLDTKEGESPLYLVVNGFHRCDSSWKVFLDVLLAIFGNSRQHTKLKVAVFYQDRDDINLALDAFNDFRVPGPALTEESLAVPSTENIVRYIVRNRPSLSRLSMQISAALDKCRGLSQLKLVIHSLRNSTNAPCSVGSVRALTEALPPPIQNEVTSRFGKLGGWARIAIGWICHAKRPLSLAELATAVAITTNTAEFKASLDPEALPLEPTDEIEVSLGGLVRFEDGGIVFITDTIKNRFLELIGQCKRETVIPDDVHITGLLIEYLSWSEIAGPVGRAIKQEPYIQPPGPLFELASYAFKFWSHHYRESAPGHPNLSRLLLSKLDDVASLSGTTPYLLAARLGLTDIINALDRDPDHPTPDFGKAIRLAGCGGHEDTVDHLLGACNSLAKEDACDFSETLRQVSARGYDNIVTKILDYAKSINALDTHSVDQLICQASQLGFESQVKLFVDRGANVDANPNGRTPIQHAVGNGHASVVRYLLHEGKADVDAKAGARMATPIVLAVTKGYDFIVEQLLSFNACTTLRAGGYYHATPLHVAASRGDSSILKRLLSETGVSGINEKDHSARSPLMIACREGNEHNARLLLEHGASVDTGLDMVGHSILFYATLDGIDESFANTIFEALDLVARVGDIAEVFFSAVMIGFTDIVARCLSESPPIKVGDDELVNLSDNDGRRALHHAAESGFREIVCLLLDTERSGPVDVRDNQDMTPLALAAIAGKDSVVELLLNRGADPLVTFESADGGVLNLVANSASSSTEGHVNSVIHLLDHGVNPNTSGHSGKSPLHSAALNGHLDLVKALLGHKAVPVDVEATGPWDWNALHFAADAGEAGAYSISELLMQAGTNPLSTDEDGWIPLHLAARTSSYCGSTELLQYLWEQDRNSLETVAADGRAALHFGFRQPTSLAWMLKHGAKIDVMDNKGMTTLMHVAAYVAVDDDLGDATRILLNNGADPLLVASDGRTALHMAGKSGQVEVGETLLTWDGDVERLVSQKDQDNCSALHVAIDSGEPQFAEMLLEGFYAMATGSALKDLSAVRQSNGETPLITAVRQGYKRVTERLLVLGAETEARSLDGNTALLLAARGDGRDSVAILRLLLDPKSDNRAEVNAGGGVYSMAIHRAASYGRIEIVKELVALDADVNAVGGRFHTALTAAILTSHTAIAEFLLENGAAQGLTEGGPPYMFYPLQAAAYMDNTELVSKLLRAVPESINLQDIQGRTALHIALRQASNEVLSELFLLARPELGTRDKQGRGLLHHAAMSGNTDTVRICMHWGRTFQLSLNVPDVDGWTPLHWACRVDDNEETVKALVDGEGDNALMKATNDGWTPESICAFHDCGSTKAFVDQQIRDLGEDMGAPDYPDSTVLGLGNTAPADEPQESPELDTRSEGLEESSERTQPAGTDPTQKDSNTKRWKVGFRHDNVSCDGCLLYPLIGVLWRCKECRDFDFCFKCFWTAAETHPGHEFKKMSGGEDDPEREPQLVDDSMDEPAEQSAEDGSGDELSERHEESPETSDDDD